MSIKAAPTTSDWMFGDVATGCLGINRWAHLNPFRWSGAQPIMGTIADLEALPPKKQDRPIVLKIPAAVFAKERRFETADAALTFLQNPELTAEWMYGDVAHGIVGIHAWAAANPLRWSGALTLAETIEMLKDSEKTKQDRPIKLKVPAGIFTPEVHLSNAEAAVRKLEHIQKQHEKAALSWKDDFTSVLCNVGEEHVFRGKARLLDTTKYKSTLSTIDELNVKPGLCVEGLCVILSKRLNQYVLLYRNDKRRAALNLFDLCDRMTWQDFDAHTKRQARSGRVMSLVGLIADLGNYDTSKAFDNKKLVMVKDGQLDLRYTRIKELGDGVGGIATLVKRELTNSFYVVKEPHEGDSPEVANSELLREFAKMQALRHPNVLKVVELLRVPRENGEKALTITECAEGGDLGHFLQDVRSLGSPSEPFLLGLFVQALRGVAFLHSNSCVHQDLKPDNLFVMKKFDEGNPDQAIRVVLADFGCSRFLGKDENNIFGDPRYIAPEDFQAQLNYLDGHPADEDGATPASDVWSMGVTLYEMMSGGVIPFLYETCSLDKLQNQEGVFHRFQEGLLNNDSVKVMQFVGGWSGWVRLLLKKMLQKDSTQRPSAQSILEDVKRIRNPGQKRRVDIGVQQHTASQLLLNQVMWRLPFDFVREYWPVFEAMDIDNAGRICFEHFTQFLSDQDPLVVKDLFEKADINNDGSLEWNEFAVTCFDWNLINNDDLEKYIVEILSDLSSADTSTVTVEDLQKFFGDAVDADELKRLFRRMSHSVDLTASEIRDFLVQQKSEVAISISCEVSTYGELRALRRNES